MICSGVYPFLAIYPPYCEIISGTVLGGHVMGTYAGWISLSSYLKKHWQVLQEGEVILVVIGVAPMDVNWSIRSYNKIPEYIRQRIKYFKLPAKVDSRDVDKARKEYLAPVIEYIKSKAT